MKLRLTAFAVVAGLGVCQHPALAAALPPHLQTSEVQPSDFDRALRSFASSNRQLAVFYGRRAYAPLWVRNGMLAPAGEALLARLNSAELDGLAPDDYAVRRIADLVVQGQGGSIRDLALAEMLLSRALVKYVRDLHRPKNVGMTYVDQGLIPKPPPARAVLASAEAGDPLDRITMMHPVYNQLRSGLAAWRSQWATLRQVPMAEGPDLAVGAKGGRVRALRARLGLAEEGGYDKTLAAAVLQYKIAHGLPATAIADASTIALLNRPLDEEEQRIRVNLERARVLPWDRARHIVVDAVSQRLWLYEDGLVRDTMKVVVGKPTEPTPMLAGFIRYAALNPYWNVPPDLVKDRVASHVLAVGLGYLQTAGYEVLSDWSDNPHVIDPATVDWDAVATGKLEIPVRQLPGPANMMGAMKFMFPNDFGVYLHDTPDKSLFGDADRRKSSGCVRLEDAKRLAKWLFGTVPTAPPTARELHVPLADPVPVYITYLTVAPEGSGLAFRGDVYQRDTQTKVRLASTT